jgi:hypothetical protein
MTRYPADLKPFIAHVKETGFINDVQLHAKSTKDQGMNVNGWLRLITPKGTRTVPYEIRNSFIDRASANAIMALANTFRRHKHQLLLLARYIPRPTGERLMAAEVNFVDLAGNIHLKLGTQYQKTILGRPQADIPRERKILSSAKAQLMFTLCIRPEAEHYTVRQLGLTAGISKSQAAHLRQHLVEEGFLSEAKRRPRPDLLLTAYTQALRPKVLIGRFQSPEKEPATFLRALHAVAAETHTRYALTGGPAADALQHFYKGPEAPIFVEGDPSKIQKQLRLLPDRQGPLILLRAFGDVVFWRSVNSEPITHPWLIYVELMNSTDPRAHEAAEKLREEYLES